MVISQSVKYIQPLPSDWEAMDTLWLGTLSFRDQGISGNLWAWTGVRSLRWWHYLSSLGSQLLD
ncbi:uncharacterized protein N7458_011430 [Penicillium daleae]|uniref:Uncharacterized protein n=1 Tax=Penicillium daleae TaxID=63821 RepID=A0AAD6BSC9_9EURO|nr:uncharacterized protein N7458_011430 [Penicillium daleae]KAJ5432274.1 hypothetical protein N7458_011430 [Penicillium daleae]